MALLPNTEDYREIPVAGNKFAQRRKIRGVGAAERALGTAWSRLSPQQRQQFGNQKNFATAATRHNEDQLLKAEDAKRERIRQQGIESARTETGTTPTAGGAVQSAQQGSTTPYATARKQQMAEYGGRNYPAEVVNDPAARRRHDTGIEERRIAGNRERAGLPPIQPPLSAADALIKRRQHQMGEMARVNPGKFNRMAEATGADQGVPTRPLPRGWQDQPDMADAVESGRVGNMSPTPVEEALEARRRNREQIWSTT